MVQIVNYTCEGEDNHVSSFAVHARVFPPRIYF